MNLRQKSILTAAFIVLVTPALRAGAASTPAGATDALAQVAAPFPNAQAEPTTNADKDGKTAAAKTPPRTRFSTQVFLNASDLQRRWVSTADEGVAVDLKRFFINLDHRFNEDWSAHLTTDVQWQRNSDPTDLFIRHAYVQRQLGKAHHVRLGNAPTPWIGYAARRNGFRYVDPDVIGRMRLGAPADWGVHAGGTIGQFSYAVAAVTGAGFQKPRTGKRADIEARATFSPVAKLELALGSYHGTRTMDFNTPRMHTAQRWTGMVSYVDQKLRLGAQFFYADNWTRVTQTTPDATRGWSAWGSYQISPAMAVFSRHDHTEMSLRLDPTREQRYSQIGMEWKHSRHLRLAVVGKRTVLSSTTRRAKADELGVWAQLMF